MTHIRVKTPNYVPGFLNAMDKLFSEDFQSGFNASNQPATNITETEKGYDITMMAPGLNKSDFKIELVDNLLSISYEKSEEKTEDTPKFIRREFSTKSFKRSFTVNDELNADQITAAYDNGLLTVSIPKVEEKEAKTKTIVIN